MTYRARFESAALLALGVLASGCGAGGASGQCPPGTGTNGDPASCDGTPIKRLGTESNPVQLRDGNGGCLDLPSGVTTNGTPLEHRVCDADDANELWYVDSGGAIHYGADASKCVDLPKDTLKNDEPLQLWGCDDGASQDQQWVVDAHHLIRKAGSGEAYCISVLGNGSADGTPVVLHSCDGSSGQTWTASEYAQTDVSLIAQQQDDWCWAATGQMILGYYGISIEQCRLAGSTMDPARNCCASPLPEGCDHDGWWPFTNNGLNATEVDQLTCNGDDCQDTGSSPLSFDQLIAENSAGRPVAFAWHYDTGGGHAMTEVGTKTTFVGGAINRFVTVNDPGPVDTGEVVDFLYGDWVQGTHYAHWSDVYQITKK